VSGFTDDSRFLLMTMLSSKGLDVIAFPENRKKTVQPDLGRQAIPSAGLTVVPYDPVAATDRRRGSPRPGRAPTSRAFQGPMKPRTLTSLFESAERGDAAAAEALFAALYGELHRMAKRELAQRGGFVTLGVTTLLHEAYIKMSDREGIAFPDRARFMAYAARVMRGLIIDHVRRRRASKRGGLFRITVLDTTVANHAVNEHELQRISDALDELAKADATLAEIVDLKFFCGFSFAEIAAMRGASERTIQRHWDKARLYLHRALDASGPLAHQRSTA
jgi:RNA polymerase sigma factor (TIGR02999 family)